MAADEVVGIAEITAIQFTYLKEEPAMTGAVAGIAGNFPATSATDSPLSQMLRSLHVS